MKANKTMKGWEVSNHRRRKDKEPERALIQQLFLNNINN
jgi:hypothetical protein